MSGGNWKEMFSAAREGDLRLVEYHVERGVDVNYVHPEILGTALVACILDEQEAVAIYLLENGADPNLVSDFEGLTPLQAARRAGLKGVEAKLLELGAEDAAGQDAAGQDAAGQDAVGEAASSTSSAPKGWFSRMWRKLG